ncbi:hypothetical protein ACP4OV_016825 [Aristida adscensionis]
MAADAGDGAPSAAGDAPSPIIVAAAEVALLHVAQPLSSPSVAAVAEDHPSPIPIV